jgi:glycosyltransferase involved in cell wall biosynthesis
MITAVIKAKNEAGQIADAIRSAKSLSDEIIVVDDSSSDNTAELARALGARVVCGRDHRGSIDLLDRQGFELVESGWILRMDADERLTPELVICLRRVAEGSAYSAVSYARLNYMFGAGVRHGGWFRPHQLGFFRADAWDRSWTAEMHTQVPVTGKVLTIAPRTAYMEHFDYESIDEFVHRTLSRYAAAEAREMYVQGVRFKRRHLLISPIVRILGRYFVRGGFLDGRRGLVLAALLGAYDVSRWSMLWELEKNGGHNGHED